ncbi:MAG: histidine phosphatase family protein [Azonexus sp.]|jgi:broad specificity phosphatase PhoE|nr:histidine phosphatase family protein [Azonexus sp.]
MKRPAEKIIHLVRHGESAANAGLPTTDPGLIPLTPRGQAQADQDRRLGWSVAQTQHWAMKLQAGLRFR